MLQGVPICLKMHSALSSYEKCSSAVWNSASILVALECFDGVFSMALSSLSSSSILQLATLATMSSSTSGPHSSVLLPTLAKSSDKMLPRARCKLVFSAKCHNTCTVYTIQCRPSIHRCKAALLRTGDNSFWFHNSHARVIGYITLSEVRVYSLSLSKQMIIRCSILLLHNTLDKRLCNHCRIWWQNTKIFFLKLPIQLHDLFSRVSLSSKLCNLLYCQLGMC